MKSFNSQAGQMRLALPQPGLFVDFHGTLSAAQFWSNLSSLSMRQNVQDYIFSEQRDLLDRWMLGEISSRFINDLICERFNLNNEAMWKKFVSHSKRLSVSGLSQLRQLREHFSVAIVTVNVDTFSSVTAVSRKLHGFVDTVANSADFNAVKEAQPRSLFHHAAAMSGASIENSVLIDDSEKACQAFRELGGLAVRVSTVQDTVYLLNSLIEHAYNESIALTNVSAYAILSLSLGQRTNRMV